MNVQHQRPQIIAHRGYSQCFPENTLIGIEAALNAGADSVEFDVQFSKDAVPIVIHDHELKRTTGNHGDVFELSSEELVDIVAGESLRFGEKFNREKIPTLTSVLELMSKWPKATAFVEIKEETVSHFGVEVVAQKMVSELTSVSERCVLISFNYAVIEAVKRLGFGRAGWVLKEWGDESYKLAQSLNPEVLFCNVKKIPDTDNSLWEGAWDWAIYDVTDPNIALRWIQRGVRYVESWDVGSLLNQKSFVSAINGIGND